MIFDNEPRDWSDLQNKVAQVFDEIGCIVEIEKEITTTRGFVNVDVFVRDVTKSPNLIYVCECKHWEAPIPKSVVHSFRTVISDYGAHVGYLITKKGYQSGAYEAATHSNIMLLTWDEFQEIFLDAWYVGMWKKAHSASAGLSQYIMPPFGGSLNKLLDENQEAQSLYWAMFTKFCAYGDVMSSHYLNEKMPLPKIIIDPRRDSDGKIKVTTYREYFEILLSSVDYATEAFEYFVKKFRLSG
jgi:hypothetical protein